MTLSIVYSNDSAFNLCLFLDSFQKNVQGEYDLAVFYQYSTDNYKAGYKEAEIRFASASIRFVDATNKVIKTSILEEVEKTVADSIMLCTGWDMFYSPFSLDKGSAFLEKEDRALSFSLRLGKNVTQNSAMHTSNVLVPLNEEDGIVTLDWSKHYVDFAKALSVHCHMYRRNEILKILKKVSFQDFDELEEGFEIFNNYPKHLMGCFEESKAVLAVGAPEKMADVVKILSNIKIMKDEFPCVGDFNCDGICEVTHNIHVDKYLTAKK